MGKLEFGISSVWLGPAAEQAPWGKMNPWMTGCVNA